MTYHPKSDFIAVMQERGFLADCTDYQGLDEQLLKGPQPGYIGFDATAKSLHVGSLIQIMMLRWLQKTGHQPIALMGGGTSKIGDPSFRDDARKLMTDEAGQPLESLDAVQYLHGVGESGVCAAGQVDLGGIAGNYRGGAEADTGEKHLHLFPRGVLGFIENDERVVQGPAAHESEGRHLDDIAFDVLVDGLEPEHLVQGVVQRPQVGVDFLAEIAGQEPQFFAGLDRGPYQQDTAHALFQQCLHRTGHSQKRLSSARGTHAEVDIALLDDAHIGLLVLAAGLDRCALGANDLNGLDLCFGGGVSQRLQV